VIPEPLFDETRRLGRPQRMAGLDWKSEAAATVIHPLLKGTGDPPERHRRGKISKTRIEVSIRVFFAKDYCHSERSEESRIFFAAALLEMFCFKTRVCWLQPFNALTLQRI
jgi:hypothetical protein